MCDPLRAKPLKWKDGAGLEAQVRRGLSGGVPGNSAHGGTTACSHRCCRFYFQNLFHASVLSGLLPGKGSLLLSLLKESEQGYRARKAPPYM